VSVRGEESREVNVLAGVVGTGLFHRGELSGGEGGKEFAHLACKGSYLKQQQLMG